MFGFHGSTPPLQLLHAVVEGVYALAKTQVNGGHSALHQALEVPHHPLPSQAWGERGGEMLVYQ